MHMKLRPFDIRPYDGDDREKPADDPGRLMPMIQRAHDAARDIEERVSELRTALASVLLPVPVRGDSEDGDRDGKSLRELSPASDEIAALIRRLNQISATVGIILQLARA
jgi:hypothetical protein